MSTDVASTGVVIKQTWTVYCYDCSRNLGSFAYNQPGEAQSCKVDHEKSEEHKHPSRTR